MIPKDFEARLAWLKNFKAWAYVDGSLGARTSVSRAEAQFLLELYRHSLESSRARIALPGEAK